MKKSLLLSLAVLLGVSEASFGLTGASDNDDYVVSHKFNPTVVWAKRLADDLGVANGTGVTDCAAGLAIADDYLIINKVGTAEAIYLNPKTGEKVGSIDLSPVGFSATGYLNNYRMTSDNNNNIVISNFSKDNGGTITVWKKKGLSGAIEPLISYAANVNVGDQLSVVGDLDGDAIITAPVNGSCIDFFRWVVKDGTLQDQTPEKIHITGYEGTCWGHADIAYIDPSDPDGDYICAAYVKFANEETVNRGAAYVDGSSNAITSKGSRVVSSNWIINAVDVIEFNQRKYAVHNSVNTFTWGYDDMLYLYDITDGDLTDSPVDLNEWPLSFKDKYGAKGCDNQGLGRNANDVKFFISPDGLSLNVFFEYANGYVGCVKLTDCTFVGSELTYDVISEENHEVAVSASNVDLTGELIIPSVIEVGGVEYAVTSIRRGGFFNCANLTSVTLPESITSIPYQAFEDCKALSEISIPNSVVDIEARAFAGCENLSSVNIPDSVISIGGSAFAGCENLSSVNIPDSVISIGGGAFNNCKNLRSVVFPDVISEIGDYTFEGCESLTSFIIPEKVTSIGIFAFYGCTGLTSITVPQNVTFIGPAAFAGCDAMEEILVHPENKNYVTCNKSLYNRDLTELMQVPGGIETDSYIIPESVTSICDYAFYGCTNLTSIDIPASVVSMGGRVFERCENLISINIPEGIQTIKFLTFGSCRSLISVNIPESVTFIDGYAFFQCSSLTSITIPRSVASMSQAVFYLCENLTKVYSLNPEVPFAPIDIFFSIGENAILYVPKGSVEAYASSEGWSRFSDIREINDAVYTLKFNVVEGEVAVEGATVTFQDKEYTTDENGCVMISDVEAREGTTVEFTVSKDGYDLFKGEIEFGEATEIDIRVELKSDMTSISDIMVDNDSEEVKVYDLYGRRVLHPVNGRIYIVNGKKFLLN